jgi:predicted nucleic acid-binding protein
MSNVDKFAVDTNVVIAWLNDDPMGPLDRLDALLLAGSVFLPPLVLTECLASPRVQPSIADTLASFTVLPITEGYWMRAGLLRSRMLEAGRRARLGDTLIAQSCLDADVALLTLDTDFTAFAEVTGLRLA